MKVTSISASDPKRKCPIREAIPKARDKLEVEHIPANTGELADLSKFMENFNDGVRQSSHFAFDLFDIRIITETIPRATSVVVRMVVASKARKEIIISAGADQLQCLFAILFQLFWIYQLLVKISLSTFNFSRYLSYATQSVGFLLSIPVFRISSFFKGMCVDWIVNEALPTETLKKIFTEDGYLSDVERFDEAGRMLVETMILYNPLATGVSVGGSFQYTARCKFIALVDYCNVLLGLKFKTLWKTRLELEPLIVESRDEEIEDQIRVVGNPHFHMVETCAMGKVLDTNLRTRGCEQISGALGRTPSCFIIYDCGSGSRVHSRGKIV
ncbi:putative glucose dehydrogenase protein [Botrytis fragariae]|uniref:Putative glucose dehydrogenase protein n=1 Tax=Botrytis fragariae TaxID=1964551 RepID=A0A8H6AZA5_9HELO|nr:putative glucose dehydrogenase protein [Botrytis fragariae]KAF5876247.1 putative glucose dehydrogenase protein [Botrytis fragariae]